MPEEPVVDVALEVEVGVEVGGVIRGATLDLKNNDLR